MSSLHNFLARLDQLDIKLSVEGDRLRCNAPKAVLTPALRAELATHKAEILSFLRGIKTGGNGTADSIQPVSRRQELPLSFAQQRLWFLNQLEGPSATYNEFRALHIEGALQLDVLEQSLTEVVRRHEILRTTLVEGQDGPIQVIQAATAIRLKVVALQSKSQAQRLAAVQQWMTAVAQQPFDLARGPLLRVVLLQLTAAESQLLVTMPHIVADGWSMSLLISELATLYRAFAQAQPSPLPPLPIQYADFAHWQRQSLQGQRLEQQLAYWRQQLAALPALLPLPTDKPRPPLQSFHGARSHFCLDATLTAQLKQLAQRCGATLFMALVAALSVLLSRYSGQKDIAIGSPIANRNRPELEPLIGFFVNTLVLRSRLEDNPSFEALLSQVRQSALAAYAHQDLPFEKLVEELRPERSLSHSPLFQVMLVLQNTPSAALTLPELELTPIADEQSSAAKFDLTLFVTETAAGLSGMWRYSTDLFEAATIARLSGHFQQLLRSIVASPQQRVEQLPLLPAAERQQLLQDWNQNQHPFPAASLPELLEAQVEKTPETLAVVYGAESLTYAELNQRANQLAHSLQQLGVGPESRVALCLERSLELLIGLWGILKAGGAYVPLDPSQPPQRLASLLADAEASVLVSQQAVSDRLALALPSLPRLCLDADWPQLCQQPRENPARTLQPSNLAYVIYTSGSTGQPKGVAIEHRSIVNYTSAILERLQPESGLRWGLVSSVAADMGYTILFPALCSGGCVHVLSAEQISDPAAYSDYLEAQAIDLLKITPSHLAALQSQGQDQGQRGLPRRQLILGGEAASGVWLRQLQARAPGCQIVNHYGPTEATVGVLSYRVEGALSEEPLPLGRPLANCRVYILDDQQQPVPIGVAGELYIGGACLARGYLQRPELNQAKFMADPFSDEPGARLYRSGDRGRYLADGNIEFLGRMDRQVKVRGFRIELGEVEAAMAEHPRLQQGVVVAVADQQGGQRLVAYGVAAEGGVSSRELRRFLRERLPEYMVPSVFVPLAALPLLPNGKLDRRALPLPETLASSPGTVPEVPLTQTEELLAAVWSELLAVAVGRHDNFFELGGHSLLAIRAIARLREVFAFSLPLSKCFELPTIAELGQYIDAEHKGGQPGAFAIQPRPRGSELPLSFAQERLWFLDQLEANSAAYNVPAAVQLVGHLDVAALQQAVAEIVRRHESLRTTFPTVQGRPIQAIAADLPITIPVVDLQDLPAQIQSSQVKQRAMAEAQRPFDLACGPLLRLSLLRLAADVYVLLINLHHIVSDGWSRRVVFVRELAALYEAFTQNAPSPLPELPVQYADFAQWQRQWLSGEVLATQLDYWRQELADPLPVLDLPTDRPRPSVQTFRGAHSCFRLSADLTQKLKALSQQSGTTLFMTLLAAFATLLSRYSDQSDIAIGSPIANRDRSELEPLIGLFLNTLVFRIDLQGNPPFLELLTRVRQKTLGAYAHQDIPFEKLMSELQTTRQLSHSPWFQVMFILQNLPSEKLELSGLTLTLLEQEGWANATAKFDLTLIMEEKGPQLEGIFEYNTDLFEAATIGRLVEHFQNLLAGIAASPHQRLSELPMLSAAEQQQLLAGRYASAYSEALTEDDSQALSTPDEDIDRLIAELAELSETEAQQLLSDAS